MRYLGNYVHGLSKKPLNISVWKGINMIFVISSISMLYSDKQAFGSFNLLCILFMLVFFSRLCGRIQVNCVCSL
ncbi:hypothetical protein Hdeb2414_s0001g00024891 [Helianthus debilis subsp. tardiflorus]